MMVVPYLLISIQKLGFFTLNLFLKCAYLIFKLRHYDHVLRIGRIQNARIRLARLKAAVRIFGDLQTRLLRHVRTVAAVRI